MATQLLADPLVGQLAINLPKEKAVYELSIGTIADIDTSTEWQANC